MARKSKAEMVTQQRAIFDLYMQGYTISQIAERVDLDYRTVQSNLKMAVAEIDVTRHLELEMARDLTRLEQLFKIYWPRAAATGKFDGSDPDMDAAQFVLKILERKSKLLGLDAAKKVDVYHLIENWARKEGLDPTDVVEAVATLLPAPADR